MKKTWLTNFMFYQKSLFAGGKLEKRETGTCALDLYPAELCKSAESFMNAQMMTSRTVRVGTVLPFKFPVAIIPS